MENNRARNKTPDRLRDRSKTLDKLYDPMRQSSRNEVIEVDLGKIWLMRKLQKHTLKDVAAFLDISKSVVDQKFTGSMGFTEREVGLLEELYVLEQGELYNINTRSKEPMEVNYQRLDELREEYGYSYKELGGHIGVGSNGMKLKCQGVSPVRDYELEVFEDLFFLDEGELIKGE